MTVFPKIRPAELLADLERSLGLPVALYQGQAAHDLDRQAIFRRHWQYICPAERVANPGDVVTGQVGEIPVIVTRDQDGALHGLVNICRHRGYRVAEGEAQGCKRLVCRYHAWTYALNGDLVRAPGSEDEPDFPQKDLSLMKVSVEEWGHMILVHADPDAPSFHACYPQIANEAQRVGMNFDPSSYVFVEEAVHEVQSNWKLWYDNYVECYHCDHIHRDSFSAAYEADISKVDTRFFPNFMSSQFPPKARKTGTGLRADNYRSLNIFPCFHILQHDDLMFLSRMYPTGPESARQVVQYYREASTSDARIREWIELWNQTFREDADATAIQQAGLRTGAVPRNRLLPVREEAVQFFNRQVLQAYQDLLEDPTKTQVAAE